MGKHFKKEKARVEVSLQSPIAVRTRSRTLALRRQQRSSPSSPSLSGGVADNDDARFLHLRSRRLEKSSSLNFSTDFPKNSSEYGGGYAKKMTCTATLAASFSRQLEAFFFAAEKIQQKILLDRYNFDPVNDRPLPGRYEWVRLSP